MVSHCHTQYLYRDHNGDTPHIMSPLQIELLVILSFICFFHFTSIFGWWRYLFLTAGSRHKIKAISDFVYDPILFIPHIILYFTLCWHLDEAFENIYSGCKLKRELNDKCTNKWATNFQTEDASKEICWFNFITDCQIFIVLQLSIRCFVSKFAK